VNARAGLSGDARFPRQRVQESSQIVAQRFIGAAERELVPRNRRLVDSCTFQALFVDLQVAANRGRGVDDDDRSAPGVRVDVDEAVESHVEPALLARFTQRRRFERFATIDVAAGKHPFPVARLDGAQMDTVTNCDPWTVRRLASHALNNQLLWAGLVTGQELVSVEDTMGAVPIEGDLAPVADDVVERAMVLWRSDGVLEAMHATPFGS